MDNKTLSNSDTGIILDDNKFYIVDVNCAFDIILKLIKSNYYFFIINAPKNNGNNQNNKLFMNKSFLKDLVRYGLSSVLMKGYNKSNEEEYLFFVTSHYRRNGILYRDIEKSSMDKAQFTNISQILAEIHHIAGYILGDRDNFYIIKSNNKNAFDSTPNISIDKIEHALSQINGEDFKLSGIMIPKIHGVSSAMLFQACGYSLINITEEESRHIIQ